VKPLELKKRPAPKKREMVRKKVVVRAKPMRLTRTVASIGGIPINIGKIYTEEDMGIGMRDIDIGAEIDVDAFRAAKEPENVLSMRDEMLSVQDLDIGRYRAMVIQDQTNKKSIKGYFHLAQVYSEAFHERAWQGGQLWAAGGPWKPLALPHLVEAMNRFTDIKTDLIDIVSLSSRELFKLPWIFIGSKGFNLPPNELENVGRYLVAGGFIVGDAAREGKHANVRGAVGNEYDISLRRMFKEALAKVEKRCTFVRITGEHPLFHCFFDFDMPPECSGTNSDYNPNYLTGISVDDRLVGVIVYNGLGQRWADRGGTYFHMDERVDNTRLLQFGVNLIVFALTQKGSITNRLMDTISAE